MPRKKRKSKERARPASDKRLETLRTIAKQAGYTDEQIANYTDADRLEAQLRMTGKPEIALELNKKPVHKPPKPVTVKQKVHKVHTFEVFVLAGGGPMSYHARREHEEIERELRRRCIRNVQTIRIDRQFTPLVNGRFRSFIIVTYEGEA